MPSPSRVLLFLPLAYATLSTVEMGPRSFYLYDYLKRPAAATSGLACQSSVPADVIKVRMSVERFHSVDMKHGTFGFDGFLVAVWSDSRLAFDTTTNYAPDGTVQFTGDCTDSIYTTYDFTQEVIDTSKQIWLPDIHVADQESVEWRDSRATTVFSNGTVEWSRAVRMVLRCSYRMDAYPYDSHTCTFNLGLYSQPTSDVTLQWTDIQEHFTSESWSLGAFTVTEGTAAAKTVTGLSNHAAQSYVTQAVTFTRSPEPVTSAYLTNCFVAVLFSYAGFFISPAAVPARTALGLLCAIFIITNKLGMTSHLPQVTYSIFLTDFLINSFFFCAAAFIEFALCHYGNTCAAWVKANPRPKVTPVSSTDDKEDATRAFESPREMKTKEEAAPAAAAAKPKGGGGMKGMYDKAARRWVETCAHFVHLDVICRYVYPVAYLIFAIHEFGGGLAKYQACADSSC